MKKIVVIDDDDGILDAFQAMLDGKKYDVTTSLDAEFLSKLSKQKLPHLIILDVLLSGNDGREICKKLKKSRLTKHIPIIMISAHPQVKKSVMLSGADDYLQKPFEMEDLLAKVNKYMSPDTSFV